MSIKANGEELLLQVGELQNLTTSKELSKIIVRIVDLVALLDMEIQADRKKWKRAELSLEKLAALAELDIQDKLMQKVRREILRIIKESNNRLILSTIKPGRN
jgi:hypothetical protein